MKLPARLHCYSQRVETTDNLPLDTIRPVLFGLFGEVGSVLATAKKRVRERALFAQYEQSLVEEFGDTLWYFAALCDGRGLRLNLLPRPLMSGAASWPHPLQTTRRRWRVWRPRPASTIDARQRIGVSGVASAFPRVFSRGSASHRRGHR